MKPKRLFLFAGYDKNGKIDSALIYYVQALNNLGDVVVFMDSDCPKSELKKVIWPSAKDVATGTMAVVVISAIIGAYIVLVDMGSVELVKLVTDGISKLFNIA